MALTEMEYNVHNYVLISVWSLKLQTILSWPLKWSLDVYIGSGYCSNSTGHRHVSKVAHNGQTLVTLIAKAVQKCGRLTIIIVLWPSFTDQITRDAIYNSIKESYHLTLLLDAIVDYTKSGLAPLRPVIHVSPAHVVMKGGVAGGIQLLVLCYLTAGCH